MSGISIASENKKAFKEGLEIIKSRIKKVMDGMEAMTPEFVRDPVANRVFNNLTGNTITSIAAGVYRNGKFEKMVSASSLGGLEPPSRRKLYPTKYRNFVFADYDTGEEVAISGKARWLVETNGKYGIETTSKFLAGMNSHSSKDSITIVVSTGTEYSSVNEGIYTTMKLSKDRSDMKVIEYLRTMFNI